MSPEKKKAEAMYQAGRYSEGSLGGFELETEKYLVLVANEEVTVPNDVRARNTMYKVISVFLTRKSQSISAKEHR
jgi:hypothetical protein